MIHHAAVADKAWHDDQYTLVMFGGSRQYDAAIDEQGKHTSLINEVSRLTTELRTAELILSKVRTAENSKATAEKTYDDAITKLDDLIAERRGLLKSAADKVADRSSNLLKARVRKDHLPETYLSALHKLFEASFTQQVEEGCVEWVKGVLVDEESGGWPKLRKSFLELYEAKIMAGSPPEASDGLLAALETVIFSGARTLTDRQRKKIYLNLTDSVIAGIVSAVPRDAINLSYIDEGRPNRFQDGLSWAAGVGFVRALCSSNLPASFDYGSAGRRSR